MFKVIRVSGGCEFVLAQDVSGGEDGPGKGQVHMRRVDHLPTKGWKAIDDKEAGCYFSGMADGMGFGEMPKEPFTTLEDVELWRERAAILALITLFEMVKKSRTSSKSSRRLASESLADARAKLAALDASRT